MHEVDHVQQAGNAAAQQADSVRYLARQPILDASGAVQAYELLFRTAGGQGFSGDGDHATRTMLDNILLYGLEKLTGGLRAYVNCTLESLTQAFVQVLPPRLTVLEILEDLDPTPELVRACCKLRASGYRLALDDFTWKPGIEPLVDLADCIKVDFRLTGPEARQELLSRIGQRKVDLLAEKVETGEEFEQARQEGFTLFQGYYFCKPILMQHRKIPPNRLSQIEILRLVANESVDLDRLAAAVGRDAALTFRILRLVNSPLYAIRLEVKSLQAALVAIGMNRFRQIATLAIASEINSGQPNELLRMAFVRARFCEQAARLVALDPTEQYLLGMVSLLPAMLNSSAEELNRMLPLREPLRQTLLGQCTPDGKLLRWIESYERGSFSECSCAADGNTALEAQLAHCYYDALLWAEAALPKR